MPGALLRQRFDARSPSRASEACRAVFGGGQVTADDGPFTFDVLSAVDDGVSVTRIASSGTDVRLSIVGASELVVVIVRDGALRMERRAQSAQLGPGALGLIPLAASADLSWSRVTVDAVSIGTASLTRLLASEGRPLSLEDARLTPRSPDLAVLWDRLARLLAGTVLEAPELYQRDLVRGQVVDALTAVTIEAFDLLDATEVDVDRDADVLRRAEAHMRGHLGDPVAVSDIAQAAGVSLRGLQLLYQRRVGTTPLLHLRALRLEAARAALQHGGAVGAIAHRFGYTNVGRFIAHYREAYGETPSRTARGDRPDSGRLGQAQRGE